MADPKVIINDIPWKLIPYGFCVCGCGQKTTIKVRRYPYKNRLNKFIKGHTWKGTQGMHPAWTGGRYRGSHGYMMATFYGHPQANRRGYVREHLLIAEKALGRPLPEKAIVHHHDDNQIIICQNQAYHMLLHQRMKAFKNSGHVNWLRCKYCHQWDDPKNLYVHKNSNSGHHRRCHTDYESERQRRKKL